MPGRVRNLGTLDEHSQAACPASRAREPLHPLWHQQHVCSSSVVLPLKAAHDKASIEVPATTDAQDQSPTRALGDAEDSPEGENEKYDIEDEQPLLFEGARTLYDIPVENLKGDHPDAENIPDLTRDDELCGIEASQSYCQVTGAAKSR